MRAIAPREAAALIERPSELGVARRGFAETSEGALFVALRTANTPRASQIAAAQGPPFHIAAMPSSAAVPAFDLGALLNEREAP